MSYLIAFVRFEDAGIDYPVQCLRTDILKGDEVIVRRTDKVLRHAKVKQLLYLNWDCNGRLVCKKSECEIEQDGQIKTPRIIPKGPGIITAEDFIVELQDIGWTRMYSRQSTYKVVLANTNDTNTSYIFIRRNGVDIRLYKTEPNHLPKLNGLFDRPKDGAIQHVNHALAHTTFNLYEGLIRYSDSFLNNEPDLSKYFVPQGSTDKRTEKLREIGEAERIEWHKAKEQNKRERQNSLYDDLSDGDGESLYLGDGVWLSSDGMSHDWGR